MILRKSVAAFNLAKKFMPGGVNSPVRSFKSVDCTPPFISHAKGSHIFDIDSNEYVDYVGSWGPMILGHAHQKVVDALKNAVERGTSYGAPTELETNLAALVQKFYPSMQVMRMVNSGTEATMSALRVARGFTRRDKIVKFSGCYHGHCDSLLVNAGSGAATFGEPSSPGVTKNIAQDTIALPYNDIDAVKKIFAECGEQIACVIVEPIAGNMGLVLPENDFLPALREVTKKFGALLIFDEVMCGFRNNVQATIQPDLTCLGKVIGGGLPCAAYGGNAEIMRNVSPDGKIYQAGTLSGNPLAMTAGITTLEILLDTPNFIADLNKKTSALVEGLKNIFGADVQVPQAGSMFSIFFADKKVTNYAEAAAANQEFFKRWFIKMLERGIYLAPSQFETLFVSAAHSDADIEKTLAAAKRSFADAAKKN